MRRGEYLEDVDLAGGAVDVELAVGRIVRIDTLTRQEVDDVLRTILVAIGGRYLHVQQFFYKKFPTRKIPSMSSCRMQSRCKFFKSLATACNFFFLKIKTQKFYFRQLKFKVNLTEKKFKKKFKKNFLRYANEVFGVREDRCYLEESIG